MFHRSVIGICLFALSVGVANADEPTRPFVIHEWGTFTVLQDEQGKTLRGVNVNEEPLPRFAHHLYPGLVKDGASRIPNIGRRSKGLPPSFSAATMRMETPIIYIYPPNNTPTTINVQVRFQGGWISEWYPNAKVAAPGFDHRRHDLGRLTRESQGSIEWNELTINSDMPIPSTQQHVWTAPREVRTPTLHTAAGQAEKYLFYRGVANIEAPLTVEQSDDKQRYRIVRNDSVGSWERSLKFTAMWLVDIPKQGVAAYNKIEVSAQPSANDIVGTTLATFRPDEYSEANLSQLRDDMKHTLIAEGLYDDEAEAMLKTWELSYFKSPGTRLFFTLPREWTDRVLPLEVTREAKIERVMIGRIELITKRQRQLLKLINSTTTSNPSWFWSHLPKLTTVEQAEMWNSLQDGSRAITDFGFDIPADYKAYLKLGRFRESIIANARREAAHVRIREFSQNYHIATR